MQVTAARSGLSSVLMEDWVGILTRENRNLARPETEFAGEADSLPVKPRYFLPQLLAITEYIGRFNINEGTSGTLFRLWNAFRVTGLSIAGELLVCYIAMVTKTVLTNRCSKEELQIITRLPSSRIRDQYQAFQVDSNLIQERCNKAMEFLNNKCFQEASNILAKVLVQKPDHGDAWYMQSLCQEQLEDQTILATACAKIATTLAPSLEVYQHHYCRAAKSAKSANRLEFLISQIMRRIDPSVYMTAVAGRVTWHISKKRFNKALRIGCIALITEDDIQSALKHQIIYILESLKMKLLAMAFSRYWDERRNDSFA